ncbi:MAG: hypothetical protein MMC33_010628 [Icmadophila ericetorum]|nr:hypothetical protein [Icmadophila ericetorum]
MGPLIASISFALATTSIAAQLTTVVTTATPSLSTNVPPCAIVSAAQAAGTTLVPAQIAVDCLNSVPLGTAQASALVDSMIPYIEWQSTLAYLKDPPVGYQLEGVDIIGGLNAISQNISSNVYQRELDFQTDLISLIIAANDGHFAFIPDIFNVFRFKVPQSAALVSVSIDGKSLPQVFTLSDGLLFLSGSGFTPSPVISINGQDATLYLQQLGLSLGGFQDPDAQWNGLMYTPARLATGSGFGQFLGGLSPLGSTTTLGFANGTQTTYNNLAQTIQNFTGVIDGPTFYNNFLSGKPSPSTGSTTAPSPTGSMPAPTLTGYPTPVVVDTAGAVAGFFPTESGLRDTAVLSIFTFEPESQGGTALQSSQVVSSFLASCRSAGKTKLVIDLTANPGGDIALGDDIFKQLFPTIQPFAGSRTRATEAMNELGTLASELFNTFGAAAYQPQNLAVIQAAEAFIYATETTVDDTNFPSWQARFSPVSIYGDNFTQITRFNLSSPFDFGGFQVSGYQGRSNVTTPPFNAQEIVVFSDGECSSTCTVFSELMIQQGGVKQIALGGRPFFGPMQHIGGVRGSQVLDWATIYQAATTGLQLKVSNNLSGSTIAISQISSLPLNRSLASSLNFRNGIRADDITQTPLQFTWEPADCRLFYTPAMMANVTAQWAAVAQAGFSPDESTCVPGSTGQQGSLAPPPVNITVYGNSTIYIPSNVSSSSTGALPIATFTGAGLVLTTPLFSSTFALSLVAIISFLI